MNKIQLMNKNVELISNLISKDIELRQEIINDIVSIGNFKIELNEDDYDMELSNILYEDYDGMYVIHDITYIEVSDGNLYIDVMNECSEFRITLYPYDLIDITYLQNILLLVIQYLENK